MVREVISYHVAKSEDFDAIEAFLLEHFVPNEPIYQALSITENADSDIEMLKKSLKDPISFIALNSKNEIIGVRLSYFLYLDGKCCVADPKDSLENGMQALDQVRCNLSSIEISDMFLDAIEIGYQRLIPEHCQKLLKFAMLCVNAEYGRRGIATKMVKLSIEKAFKSSCDGILAQATALASQNLFRKENFEILKAVKHENFLDENGKQLIRCKDGTNQGQLLFKRLSN